MSNEVATQELNRILELYPTEMANDLIANKEKLNKVLAILNSSTTKSISINSMIMECKSTCPYKNMCVLVQGDIAPFGYACPIEKKIVTELECDIVEYLGIDRNNPIEMELLWDLLDAKLLDMRSSGALKDGSLIQVIEQKSAGSVMVKQEISPTLEAKIMLKEMKHEIIDSFAATRRARKKYGMKEQSNALEEMLMKAANNVGKS